MLVFVPLRRINPKQPKTLPKKNGAQTRVVLHEFNLLWNLKKQHNAD